MTTGAGNDIERASELARKMVCEFGMSTLGPITFGKKEEQIFLGREISQHRDFSRRHGPADRRRSSQLRRRGLPVGVQHPRPERGHHAPAWQRLCSSAKPSTPNEIKMIIEGASFRRSIRRRMAQPAAIQR